MRGGGADVVPGDSWEQQEENKDCRHTRFIDTCVKMQRDQLPHCSVCFLLNRGQCGVLNISEQHKKS